MRLPCKPHFHMRHIQGAEPRGHAEGCQGLAAGCRQDLEARLSQLAAKLTALRGSFALIQDMVDLPGVTVWHAELSRVIGANMAAEMRR